jgi:hypothetical protein
MCRAVQCRSCGKTTWAGCGKHVDHVMAGVAKADQCPGHHPVAAARPSVWARLFGRR